MKKKCYLLSKILFCSVLALFTACTQDSEEFTFQVAILPPDGGVFSIPLSGRLDEVWQKPYHWHIKWGDGTKQTISNNDLNAPQNAVNSKGISKKYTAYGTYTITITPAGSTDAWLAAFGFCEGNAGANNEKNKWRVKKVISPLTPLMTRTQAQIASGEAPDNEWRAAFYDCSNLTMDEGFKFSDDWNNIAVVGNNFARGMFHGCYALTMNNIFNLPSGIKNAGDGFACEMFANCQNPFFSMNEVFNLPEGIINAKDGFAQKMFLNCSGAAFTMNRIFNLPAGITVVGNDFAHRMFHSCEGAAFTMNDVFNLPTGITAVGDNFANYMFYGCDGAAFLMNDVFNLPAGITTVGNYFAADMFAFCQSAAFTMNDLFNLPTGITTAGSHFASEMFAVCKGAAFSMNKVFTLPSGITTVGDNFAGCMFFECKGPAFTMNEVFNLPAEVKIVGNDFVHRMFAYCSGAGFMVNKVFVFPVLSKNELNKSGVFFRTFFNLRANTVQKRTAASIIWRNTVPTADKETFFESDCFPGRSSIHQNWGND